MKWTICLGLILASFFGMDLGLAQSKKELVVGRPTTVYSKPKRGARKLIILQRGMRVPVSPRPYGRWYKVLVKRRGKKQIGFVRRSALRGASIETAKKKRNPYKYRDGIGIGVDATVSITSQDSREFDDGEGSPKQISNMEGTSTFFGIFGDFPLSESFVLRGSVTFRENSFTGDFGIEGQDTQKVELTQSFFSVGSVLKYYPFQVWPYWIGLATEFANGTSVSLVYGNDEEVPVSSEDLPFFIFVQGVLGADFHIWENVYLIPDFRYGSVVNTDPSISSIEGRLSFAYRF